MIQFRSFIDQESENSITGRGAGTGGIGTESGQMPLYSFAREIGVAPMEAALRAASVPFAALTQFLKCSLILPMPLCILPFRNIVFVPTPFSPL